MLILRLCAFAVVVSLSIFMGHAQSANGVVVPRKLAVTACEVIQMVWVVQRDHPAGITPLPVRKRVDEVEEGEEVIEPPYAHWQDLEWNIIDGKLDCRHDIMSIEDAAELEGAPPTSNDLSRHLQCQMAAMSIAKPYADKHPGWWPFAVGCPNPMYNHDGKIVGYQMPACPSEINGIQVKCMFSEDEI